MSQEIINIGVLPNDGQGDPLRVAFNKINNNFTELYSTTTEIGNTYSVGNTANQVILVTPANTFTTGEFTIRSSDPGSNRSQMVTISAQINNAGDGVKFTAYGTTFYGNAITKYDMNVVSGNVRILVSPLIANNLLHFISSKVLFIGNAVPGIPIQLDGYIANSVMGTETLLEVTTEN